MQSKAEWLEHIDSIEFRTTSNAEHLSSVAIWLVLLSITIAWVHAARRLAAYLIEKLLCNIYVVTSFKLANQVSFLK